MMRTLWYESIVSAHTYSIVECPPHRVLRIETDSAAHEDMIWSTLLLFWMYCDVVCMYTLCIGTRTMEAMLWGHYCWSECIVMCYVCIHSASGPELWRLWLWAHYCCSECIVMCYVCIHSASGPELWRLCYEHIIVGLNALWCGMYVYTLHRDQNYGGYAMSTLLLFWMHCDVVCMYTLCIGTRTMEAMLWAHYCCSECIVMWYVCIHSASGPELWRLCYEHIIVVLNALWCGMYVYTLHRDQNYGGYAMSTLLLVWMHCDVVCMYTLCIGTRTMEAMLWAHYCCSECIVMCYVCIHSASGPELWRLCYEHIIVGLNVLWCAMYVYTLHRDQNYGGYAMSTLLLFWMHCDVLCMYTLCIGTRTMEAMLWAHYCCSECIVMCYVCIHSAIGTRTMEAMLEHIIVGLNALWCGMYVYTLHRDQNYGGYAMSTLLLFWMHCDVVCMYTLCIGTRTMEAMLEHIIVVLNALWCGMYVYTLHRDQNYGGYAMSTLLLFWMHCDVLCMYTLCIGTRTMEAMLWAHYCWSECIVMWYVCIHSASGPELWRLCYEHIIVGLNALWMCYVCIHSASGPELWRLCYEHIIVGLNALWCAMYVYTLHRDQNYGGYAMSTLLLVWMHCDVVCMYTLCIGTRTMEAMLWAHYCCSELHCDVVCMYTLCIGPELWRLCYEHIIVVLNALWCAMYVYTLHRDQNYGGYAMSTLWFHHVVLQNMLLIWLHSIVACVVRTLWFEHVVLWDIMIWACCVMRTLWFHHVVLQNMLLIWLHSIVACVVRTLWFEHVVLWGHYDLSMLCYEDIMIFITLCYKICFSFGSTA